ncbi:MAG: cytidine deaminase [Lachnospiraceae bacterium]|nr:cytidine deaminase [Lachnospiraceae bacterium]
MSAEAKKRLEEQLKKETGGVKQSYYDRLIRTAVQAMKNAYAPYSGFAVGAALAGKNGKIYVGCNVENASYSLTNCAERTAFFNAAADGCRHFDAIAIVGGKNGVVTDYCLPCGACRQVMAEFCSPDFEVIMLGSKDIKVSRLKDLLPDSFRLP